MGLEDAAVMEAMKRRYRDGGEGMKERGGRGKKREGGGVD